MVALLLLLWSHIVTSQKIDLTEQPGATGAAVVEATVERIQASCIFGDDKLFLRRLAYVLTSDGLAGNTDANGGIWKVCSMPL